MQYRYEDREGQIAELYGSMISAVHLLRQTASWLMFPGVSTLAKRWEGIHESFVANLKDYRPEVKRLNHPLLTETFSKLEELSDVDLSALFEQVLEEATSLS